MLYKIGEFSMINKISQRMLRYYDEKDLLKPRKDEKNGYRYYTNDYIEIVNRIKFLRKCNFSIDEIKNILKMDSEDIKIAYQNKVDELGEKAIEYFDVIEELKSYIESNYTINIVNAYDVFWGVKKSFHALCLRRVVDEDGLELLIDKLNNSINKLKSILNGKYFAIFHSVEERDFYLYDVEVCQPILVEREVNDSRIKFFKEANYISTIHIGNYDSISNAYAALYNWASSNGYILSGPYIEKYYTDEYVTLDKNTFVTEVSIAVKKLDIHIV
ncbi:MAG: MerR family transcriptional regulator [Clostridiaceae bacterium]|nr:MerR family transcriptional regulator [Clostridiaceae bacterium]